MRWLLSSVAAGLLGLAAIGPAQAGDGGRSRFYTPAYPQHGHWDRHPGHRFDGHDRGHYHPGPYYGGYGVGYPYRYRADYPGYWYGAPRSGVYFNFGVGSGVIGF